MKGDVRLEVLNIVARTALAAESLFEATVRAGYGASMGRMKREFDKIDRRNERVIAKILADQNMRIRYSKLLHHLKRDGLIEKDSSGLFNITVLGRKKRDKLEDRHKKNLPDTRYEKLPAQQFAIVAFDIPEKERIKRVWLRGALTSIGMQMIQKSVWIGRVRVPPALLKDLRNLQIIDCVEIFAITKTGTLRHIS
jgi:CRISPR/Cas system-associated endoribonuclease Cas2